jgi:hypothetical protein
MRKLWKIKRSLDTSKEKPTMRLIVRTWLALVTASLGLSLGLPVCGLAQNAQNDQGPGIKLGVPNGTYVFNITGLVPPTPGATTLVPLAAVGRVTYFANGHHERRNVVLSRRNSPDWGHIRRYLHGQYRWQRVGDRPTDQPARATAAF